MRWLRQRRARRRLAASNPEISFDLYDRWVDLALARGQPLTWHFCGFCGEWSWAHPPHDSEPCPHQTSILESAGMAADAHRNLLAGTRQHMEEVTRHMRESFGEEDE